MGERKIKLSAFPSFELKTKSPLTLSPPSEGNTIINYQAAFLSIPAEMPSGPAAPQT
jgi:hypothetical protein